MSERYWRWQAAAALLAGATAATVAGCGSGSGNAATGAVSNGASASGLAGPAGTGADAGAGQADATAPAAMTAIINKTGITAPRLREALLTKIDGAGPVGAVQSGEYGILPDVLASKQSLQAVSVTPARCAKATATGFDSELFSASPASVVTFRVGRDGVSEVLVAATPEMAARALANHVLAGCDHYQATVAGRTFSYAVQEATLSGIADQARALNVKASGYADVDVWSVVYRGTGFVGAVTIVGPDATEKAAKLLARDAYARAAEILHPRVH